MLLSDQLSIQHVLEHPKHQPKQKRTSFKRNTVSSWKNVPQKKPDLIFRKENLFLSSWASSHPLKNSSNACHVLCHHFFGSLQPEVNFSSSFESFLVVIFVKASPHDPSSAHASHRSLNHVGHPCHLPGSVAKFFGSRNHISKLRLQLHHLHLCRHL